MNYRMWILLVLVSLIPCGLQAETTTSGTVSTVTIGGNYLTKTTLDWITSADAASSAVLHLTDADFFGIIHKVALRSDATTAPTNLYDVTLVDSDGVDKLVTGGANVTSAATVVVYPTMHASVSPFIYGPLTLTVLNAGASKRGYVDIYIQRYDSRR